MTPQNKQNGKFGAPDSVNDSNSARKEPPHSAASPVAGGWPAEPKQVQKNQPASSPSATARQPSPHFVREGWMEKIIHRNAVQTISANELTSLSALIAYAAHRTGMSEYRIERDLADRFNVANVQRLPAARYDEALRYLVDQIPANVA